MEKIELKVENRVVTGSKVSALRSNGLLPAVIYGHNFEAVSLQVPIKDFIGTYGKAGESTLVYLKLNNQEYPTIIHDVAVDPVTDKFLHADFYKVNLDEEIEADIPVVITGDSSAVKDLGGILIKNISEIKVVGLPENLPHEIVVDISGLSELNSHVAVKDLKVSDKIKIKENPEELVVLVQEPISEEELKAQLEAETKTTEEVEVIAKEKPEEEEIAVAEDVREKTQ